MARNTRGQITSTNRIKVELTKKLQRIANEISSQIKPMIRDELEDALRHEVYASYTPAVKREPNMELYDKPPKHSEPRPYEHTGLLVSSIYAVIDGDIIKAEVEDLKYPNGASTREVYDYLKFGTTKNPKNDTYSYDNGKSFTVYAPQEPHNFEARTREHMNQFLNDLKSDIKNNPKKYYRTH